VILIDVNILLYAHDRMSPQHESARTWLETTLSGDEEVRFAMHTLLGFLRMSTNPSIFERTIAADRAIEVIREWLGLPNVAVAMPTDRHWQTLAELAAAGQARGPLLMDAHLAALALEHGATLATTDRDFARFPGLRFRNPLGA
jgi:toxin-antitoxin system PIN domain toxin